MFRIVFNSIYSSFGRTSIKPHKLLILRIQEYSSIPNQDSFTVKYLMNEFGFSLEKSILASKNMHFQNRDKPDAVVSFLKNQGFSQTQIKQVISVRSRILIYNPEKTLLPKIEFFRSKGASSTDLAKMIGYNPNILERSLKHHISPAFKFFRDYFGCDQSVICMLKGNAKLLNEVELRVKPNIEVLRRAGVPYSNVVYLLKNKPNLFPHSLDELKKSIGEVQKMGMDPQSSSFSLAVLILTTTPISKWNEKMEAYKRWGCSEDEVLTSFRILPWIMAVSEEKINGVMSFCVHEMGWDPSNVVRMYSLFLMSLNKRLRPRWSVYKELLKERLVVKEESKMRTMFAIKEDLFLDKYVHSYKDEAPLLLKLYLEKLEASK